ncbi:MAG TPA: Fe-S oxidoreductase, partial [Flammeovirgaceae bacterium]|nr:Fe-S oxidoreductase [Flammeovirgaceae bacterium]
MMTYVAQVLFVLLLAGAGWLLARRIRFIRAAIGLGKPEQRTDHRAARWRNMLLVAFGQRKMFKKPIPALLHLFVYVGFLLINIEVLEIIIDGLAGTHRIFAPYLGHAYTWLLN